MPEGVVTDDQAVSLYSKGKNGQGVLIIHGFTSHISQTDMLYDYLALKGFTVHRPILPGHNGDRDRLEQYGPAEWVDAVKEALQKLAKETEEIFVIGISFGGNISISACKEFQHLVKGLAVIEMPVRFTLRIWFLMTFIQPLFQLFGITHISKEGHFYRNGYIKSRKTEITSNVPVNLLGKIRQHINQRTKLELRELTIPTLFMQAQKSDLLSKNNAKCIYNSVPAKHKRLYMVDADNHDLSLLDESGRILMLEEVYGFVKHIFDDNTKK